MNTTTGFPAGRKVGPNSRRWVPSELLEWEREHGIELPEPGGMLDVRQVARRYSVSVPTVWRWVRESRGVADAG